MNANAHWWSAGSSPISALRRIQYPIVPSARNVALRSSSPAHEWSGSVGSSNEGRPAGSDAIGASASSSTTWNDTDRFRIAPPDCLATTWRVVKERPSRNRSTSYRIGSSVVPGRMKYECSECAGRSEGTVNEAARNAWATTCPPNRRPPHGYRAAMPT